MNIKEMILICELTKKTKASDVVNIAARQNVSTTAMQNSAYGKRLIIDLWPNRKNIETRERIKNTINKVRAIRPFVAMPIITDISE